MLCGFIFVLNKECTKQRPYTCSNAANPKLQLFKKQALRGIGKLQWIGTFFGFIVFIVFIP